MKTLKTAIKHTLIIDKEELENTSLINIYKENGLSLDIVSEEHDYMNKIHTTKYDCVMIDSELPNNQTIKIIDEVKGNYPWMIVIIILKKPEFDRMINYVRLGVDDFLLKPFTWEDLETMLRHYFY
jgi:DNA-binding NtrC family response regulator